MVAEPFAREVTATGQLAPIEEVVIVSELSRRLVKIHVEEGAEVEKGDVLYQVDGAELAAQHARLKVQRDMAARVLYRREEALKESKLAMSPHEMDVAQTNLATLDAELREVATELAKTRIRAPFSGVLGTRQVSEGAWLTPEVPITTLYDTRRFKIDFSLPERYAPQIAVGATFEFTLGGERAEGTIAVVEPAVDTSSRSIRVRGVIAAAPGMVAGRFVTVRLDVAARKAVLVPSIAVEPSVDGHRVWVVEEGKAQRRKVTIGERTVERLEITSGLEPGEQVITSNLLQLSPGAEVVVEAP